MRGRGRDRADDEDERGQVPTLLLAFTIVAVLVSNHYFTTYHSVIMASRFYRWISKCLPYCTYKERTLHAQLKKTKWESRTK